MQLEPPSKRAKFAKSRAGVPSKGVAKQSKNGQHSSQSADACSSSDIQAEPQRQVCSTSNDNVADSNAATNNRDGAQKQNSGVERVIVGQPVYHGDINRGQFVSQWDPYVMVETVSNVRLFPGHPIIDSGTYMTSSVSNPNSHASTSGLRMTNVTSIPMYGSSHTSLTKEESSQQSAKTKGYSKKGRIPYSHSGKDKGPQKGKAVIGKGRWNYQKNKDGKLLLSDVSTSQSTNSTANKETKACNKSLVRTASSGRGESSRQKRQYGESSRAPSSHRAWPSIPNLDYSSGKRLKVTFNSETVFITQYKLLK